MYPLMQPLLHIFRWVWFLDQDISFQGFRVDKLLAILQKNYPGKLKPLIMQPTLHQSTEWNPVFSKHYWYYPNGNEKFQGARGGQVRFIEQQMPIFRSNFLSWYLDSVIIPLENITRALRSNWGIENLWCKAAEVFTSTIFGVENSHEIPVCVVLVDRDLVVHHLNTKSILMKRGKYNHHIFRELSVYSINMTARLYPNWYSGIKGSKTMGAVRKLLQR